MDHTCAIHNAWDIMDGPLLAIRLIIYVTFLIHNHPITTNPPKLWMEHRKIILCVCSIEVYSRVGPDSRGPCVIFVCLSYTAYENCTTHLIPWAWWASFTFIESRLIRCCGRNLWQSRPNDQRSKNKTEMNCPRTYQKTKRRPRQGSTELMLQFSQSCHKDSKEE